MSDTPSFSLSEAAEAVGVSSITLKRWLLAGRVRDVVRDRNGWRVFTSADIDRIQRFAEQRHSTDNDGPQVGVASFFSGIGGIDLGFDRAGFSIKYQCEIDEYCRTILEAHWPGVPRAADIREVKSADVPVSEVWVGGFPCQDVSLARMGARTGLRGRKSRLFHEYARLIGEARPRVVVIENVPGLLSSHGGRDFEIVVRSLAEFGYSVGWRTLNSRYFGVPQSRQRVYIVGCYRDRSGPAEILFEPQCGEGNASACGPDGESASSPFKTVIGDPSGQGPVIQSIAYCLYACSARHTGTDWSRNYVCYPALGEVRRLTPEECEGVMSFPSGWTIPPSDGGFKEADLDSLRYYALGNAVTPPVAEWLAGRIREYLATRNVVSGSVDESVASA